MHSPIRKQNGALTFYLHKSWTPTRIPKTEPQPSHTQLQYTPPSRPRSPKITKGITQRHNLHATGIHRIMDPSRLPRAPNIWLTQHNRPHTAMATSRLPRAPNTWTQQHQQLRNNWTPVGCPGRQTSGHNKHSSTYLGLPFPTA